jgi:hypothetical protein
MIDKLQLLQQALVRVHGAQKPSPTAAAGTPSPSTAAAAARAPAQPRPALEAQIRQRLASIKPDDPHRRRRGLRATLEVCLLSEFGERLSADPAFHELIDKVLQQIDGDPALKPLVDEVLESLSA